MILFPEYPHVRRLGPRREFRIEEPYAYQWVQDDISYRLVIPAGFVCDLASIPRATWSVFPPHRLDKAAAFHDLLYRRGGEMHPGEFQRWDSTRWSPMAVAHAMLAQQPEPGWIDMEAGWTRKQADVLFRRHLREDPEGPAGWRRSTAYRMVRWFGGGAWQG